MRCKEITQYYKSAEDNCGSCEQLCYEHVLQGTTRDCETHCADYLESMKSSPSTSVATTPSATTSFAPTPGSADIRHEALLYGLLAAVAVTVILVVIICRYRKRLRKCFKRCPPIDKPPDDVVTYTEMGLNRRGIAPADDGRAERNRLAIEGQNPHPIQRRDEPRDCPAEAEAGGSERTPMMPDQPADPDLNGAASRPRDQMLCS